MTAPGEVKLARHATDIDDDGHHAGRWEPVTDGDVAATEFIFEDGDIVMEWVPA